MNDPIDIIVMWVDCNDTNWIEKYNKYKIQEIQEGTQAATNAAAFDPARYRDWGIFKYWFRGVEKNCPWVHKVFLVVDSLSQVPKWLNINHEKLRIVTHEEFIPKDVLPTFNGPMIEMWYGNIPDLSENFIACDDDYFFINQIPENWFFEYNIPMTEHRKICYHVDGINDTVGNWQHILSNSRKFVADRTGNYTTMYEYTHLPEPRKKSFEQKFLQQYSYLLYDSMKISHFRHQTSYTSSLYMDWMRELNISHYKPVYAESCVFCLINIFTLIHKLKMKKYKMICLNDVDCGSYTQDSFNKLHELFDSWFPTKSAFEL